jgi:RND family efflux transporter MFP subunit
MGDVEGTGRAAEAESAMLAELARAGSLAERSAWAARWAARLVAADSAVLFVVDPGQSTLVSTGAFGETATRGKRKTASREEGLAAEVLRERETRIVRGDAADPLVVALPRRATTALVAPLPLEKGAAGIVVLGLGEAPAPERLAALERFLRHAAAAVEKAREAEGRTVGLLAAIERLTSLYDVTKAFGSTIDLGDLSALVARKAADFAVAEVASLWFLDSDNGDVSLAATAVNGNYDVASPPEFVGGSLVGDVLADRTIVRKNALADDDPLRHSDPSYETRSALAVPLVEDDAPIGVLVAVNKRGRNPEFTQADEELLTDVSRQAVNALRNARRYEAEKRVAELDALLAVSREITATLDLDKVMKTIVNASSALIQYDRCAIGIMQKGHLRVGAISGMASLERSDPSVRRTEELLQWVFYGGKDVAVEQTEDGRIVADRPETEEKFRVFFRESGMNAYYGLLLQDEEGKLAVLGFESREPLQIDEERHDLVQILVNQATVAVRNAQLYQQVPLSGFLKPLLERRQRLAAIPLKRRRAWAIAAAVTLVLLFAVPWPIRVAGPTRILPGRRVAVTAEVDGVIKSVERREGDTVRQGDVIAVLQKDDYEAALAHADAAFQIAESNVARYRHENDASAMFQALAQRDEYALRVALAKENLSRVNLKAPAAGVVVTPHLEDRIGQILAKGAEFCVLADVAIVTAEVAVPEADASLLKPGQQVALKLNPYPTRVFRGRVTRIGAEIHQEGEERFVIAESQVENPDGLLKAGMVGRGKVVTGTRSMAFALMRKPARYLWTKLWPVLP